MFQALRDAGHRLQILVRPQVQEFATRLVCDAEVIALDGDPYGDDQPYRGYPRTLEAVRNFRPSQLVVATSRWTPFDAALLATFPGIRAHGLQGEPGHALASRRLEISPWFHALHRTSAESHALEKCDRLTAGVLGISDFVSPRPSIVAGSSDLREAQSLLDGRMGGVPPAFWIACMGSGARDRDRCWSAGDWVECIRNVPGLAGSALLLIGTGDETEESNRIAAGLAGAGITAVSLCGHELSPAELIGLIAMSAGYAGKDTGPMHVACALNKPVVAVFAGGTWPNYTPWSSVGHALMVDVACTGCLWRCPFPEKFCITRASPERLARGWQAVISGSNRGLLIDRQAPDPGLTWSMMRTLADHNLDLERRVHRVRLRDQLSGIARRNRQKRVVFLSMRRLRMLGLRMSSSTPAGGRNSV